MKITDYRIRTLPDTLREELFSFVPRKRAVGMAPEDLTDVLDAYGRSDLAVSALQAMGLSVPAVEPNEPAKLHVLVADESYAALYETSVEDRYTRRGKLSEEAAKELFRELSS